MTPGATHAKLGATQTLTGRVVHARKCFRRFFFLDLRVDEATKHQVLFRSDDGSLTQHELEDLWRVVRRGDVVRVDAGEPLDRAERVSREYPVSQGCRIEVLERWEGKMQFVQERALGTREAKKTTVIDGVERNRAGMPCKFWLNNRKCDRGDECVFMHPVGEELWKVREQWIKERLLARRLRTQHPQDPHSVSDKKLHSRRAFLFAQWLVDTFGIDLLVSGSGVLDVAGGKGDVSMFLCHLFGVPSTIIEPRPRKISRWWRRRIEKVIAEARGVEGGDGSGAAVTAREEGGSDGQQALDDPDSDDDEEELAITFRDSISFPTAADSNATTKPVHPSHIVSHLDEAFVTSHAALLRSCSVLIGMHPDQATEPIVATALRFDKPFAVVPCCVFGHENRHRRLKDGGGVVTTPEFVRYLVEKDDGIKTAWLGFEGSNVVVYRGGKGE